MYIILEVSIIKKINVGTALFTGLFVGIIVFLSEYLIPNTSLVISVIIAGLSGLVGGLIGNKLFRNKSWSGFPLIISQLSTFLTEPIHKKRSTQQLRTSISD